MTRARPMPLLAAACLLGAIAFAGAAQAETAAAPAVAISLAKVAAPTADAGAALPLPYTPDKAPLPEGIAQTSVEHHFASKDPDAYVGAAGLLCGLKPEADNHGAAAAYGNDPDGKFVGAKFTLTF